MADGEESGDIVTVRNSVTHIDFGEMEEGLGYPVGSPSGGIFFYVREGEALKRYEVLPADVEMAVQEIIEENPAIRQAMLDRLEEIQKRDGGDEAERTEEEEREDDSG